MLPDDQSSSAFPVVTQNALKGHYGEVIVDSVVTKMGLIFRSQTGPDLGIDGVIEMTTTEEGNLVSTGRQIGVQIKHGGSIVKKTERGFTLYVTPQHARYWLNHSLPVIVTYVLPDLERILWSLVSDETLRETSRGYALDFDESSDLRSATGICKIYLKKVASLTRLSAIVY